MKRYLQYLFVIVFTFLIFVPKLKANTTGTGGIGGYGGSIAGTSGSGGWNDWMYGIHVGVFDENNNKKSVKSYDLKIKNWINGKKVNEETTSYSVDPTKLYEYLDIPYNNNTDNYSELLSLIDVDLKKGDYILIEPFTYINGQKASNRITFREIIQIEDKVKGFPFYNFYGQAAMILANSAKVGSKITVGGHTYSEQNNTCTESSYKRKNFCGWENDHYVGFGITVVSYDQIKPYVPSLVETGSFKLQKIDGNTGDGISGVEFQLSGNNGTYTCITNSSGVCEINNIIVGEYTLKETKTAKFYPDNNNSWGVTITANSTNDYYYNNPITNTKTCVSEFEDNVNKRLELYKKYALNNLLNFNIHSAKDACTASSCQKNSSISCLNYSSSISEFNEYNLSCYDDTIEVNNVTGYCVELFDFNNTFNSIGNYNFGTINSGQLIIKQDISKIGTGTLKKICYLPNTQNGYNGTFNYTDYVSNIKLQDVSLIHDNKAISLTPDNYASNGFVRYTSETKIEYNLPKVFSSIGDGKKIYGGNCTNCRFLGYGMIENINLSDGVHYLSFNVNLNINKLKSENVSSKSCSYNVKNKITTCEDNDCKLQKLNLEFRTIDTNNPFPGKSGSSRKTGENWCDNDSCASKNQNVCSNIINKKNSYTSGTAKYTIILNSNEINKIRQDNSSNKSNGVSYDDFSTLNCDENNNCTSNYLDQLKNRTISDKNGSTYVLLENENYDSTLSHDNFICK